MTQVDQNITGDSNQVIGQIDKIVAPVVNLTVYDQLPQIVSQGAVVASQPLTQQEYRQRKVLLNKVKEYWIKGVLERSLHSQVLLELGLEEKPEMVQRPFREADEFAMTSGEMLPEGTNATSLFDEMGEGRTLLVLGEPGSGKTITLLKLAETLVARAEADLSLPIPVVVNLSSWEKKEKSFATWLCQELYEKYQVSKEVGATLIQQEALVLLLDGLDEVSSEYRDTCVTQVNQFIQEHGATEISVCCRVRDYEKLSQRLILRCSIYIHPLSFDQVDEYLVQAGEQLSSLRKILEADLELKKIATTPLILSIMSMAYQYYVLEDFQSLASADERRQHLLDSYIERMLYRREASQKYPRDKVKRWLAWLASNMQRESKTIFLIESLQPSSLYKTSTRNLFRFIAGAVLAVLFGTIVTAVMRFSFPSIIAIRYGLIFGFLSGLYVIFLDKIRVVGDLELSLSPTYENLKASTLVSALFLLASRLFLGQFYLTGTLCAFLSTLFVTQIRSKVSDSMEHPNQGIWMSLRNSLVLGVGALLSTGIVYSAAYWLLFAPDKSIYTFITNFLIVGFQAGTVGGLFVAAIVGGIACVQHLVLRYFLFKRGSIPWNCSDFLDNASELLFLQKVGGGYIFIHRMLLEHFAQMQTNVERANN